MAFLSGIFEQRGGGFAKNGPLDDYWYMPRGAPTHSGASVDGDTILTLSAVWNAVWIIAGTIGSLPLHLYKSMERGKKKMLNNQLYNLMHTSPNPEMTSMAYRECCAAHALVYGNSYSEKVSDAAGRVYELWPIPSYRVCPERDVKKRLVYKVNLPNGETRTFSRDKILHVPGLSFNAIVGKSVVTVARESIGLGMAQEEFASRYFGSGTHPGVVVSHPGKLGPEAHQNLKTSLTDAYSGLGNAHRLLLLEEAMKIEKVGFAPDESQFLESRKHSVEDVARWFNIPLHKLKNLDRATHSNIEAQNIEFIQDTIQPWLVRFEQNYGLQLLNINEQKKLFFKHSIEGYLRGDTASRAKFYKEMFSVAAFSPNKILEFEDMDPVEGGDQRFVQLGYAPLDKISEYFDNVISAKIDAKLKVPQDTSDGTQSQDS